MCEIFGAATNTLFRIEAVAYAEFFCRALGQHHQATYTGFRAGLRIPVGLLITNGGQKLPFQPKLFRVLSEQRFILGHALLQVFGESIGTYIAHYVEVTVVTFDQRINQALFTTFLQEHIDCIQQAGVACIARLADDPLQVNDRLKTESQLDVRKVHLMHCQLVGVDHGNVDLAFIDHA